MPYRNRVDPYGRIFATGARGALTGNRGILHDNGVIVRPHRGVRWICCQLQFKDRKAKVMAPGHYTHLFFLDEATALAAGHRPCATCRHADYTSFHAAWTRAHPGRWTAPEIDRVLHGERLAPGPRPARPLAGLPSGCMVEWAGEPHLIRGNALLPWTPSGYGGPFQPPEGAAGLLLTPASIVRTLLCGYGPIHPKS